MSATGSIPGPISQIIHEETVHSPTGMDGFLVFAPEITHMLTRALMIEVRDHII
jgi:hypothetical protein